MGDWTVFTNGTVADADEVNANFSYNTTVMLRMLMDGATSTSQKNLVLSPSYDSTTYDNAYNSSVYDGVVFAYLLSGWAIDATGWSTFTNGQGTETTSVGTRSATTSAQSINNQQAMASMMYGGSSAVDFKALADTSEVLLTLQGRRRPGSDSISANSHVRFGIADTDDSAFNTFTGVQLLIDGDIANTSNSYLTTKIHLLFDVPSQQVRCFVDDVEDSSSPFNLSSLSNYYLKIHSTAAESSSSSPDRDICDLILSDVMYIDGTSATGNIETADVALDEACLNGIITFVSDAGDEADITCSLSTDGGVTYTAVTTEEWGELATTDSTAKIKFSKSIPTSVSTTTTSLGGRTITNGSFYAP